MMRWIAFWLALMITAALAQNLPAPSRGTDRDSTVASGGAFQQVIPAGNKYDCVIQNPSAATETLFVYFGPIGSATTGGSINLAAGAAVSCSSNGAIRSDQVSVTATTTGHAFVAYSVP